MGQKANLQTIRKVLRSINLIVKSPKEFIVGFNFLSYFNRFFVKKNVILTNVTLNFINNRAQLNLELFYRTALTKKLKKKLKTKKKSTKILTTKKVMQLVLRELKLLRITLLSVNYSILNKKLEQRKDFVNLLYSRFKYFQESLFPRRMNLFFDFLKISALFSNEAVNIKNFLFIIAQTFRFLLKKQHARFFSLLKKLFKIYLKKSLTKCSRTNILGLKFLISGRIKGKLRSQRKLLKIGEIPNQTFSKNIEFEKINVYTRYCVFGLKLWVYRSVRLIKK